MKFGQILVISVISLSLLSFLVFVFHTPLQGKVLKFYDVGEIDKFNVITVCIYNPTDKNYTLAVIVNAHRYFPLFIVVRGHARIIVNITAPDPTVAIPFHSAYVITFYIYGTQTAVLSIYGFAPASVIYPIVNPNFQVLYNDSYGETPWGWEIFYAGNVTVEKGKVIVHGEALIEQPLNFFINGTVTVVYNGGYVNATIVSNTVVIYAVNTTVYGVKLISN